MTKDMSPLPFSQPRVRLWEVGVVDWRNVLAPYAQHDPGPAFCLLSLWVSLVKGRGPFALREEHRCCELDPLEQPS